MGWPRALLATLWALEAAGAAALRIGAFNIQSFGDSKVSDPDCGSIIAKILAGYDLALVQEVRDPDLSAVSALMELINRCGGQGSSSRPPAGILPRRGALTRDRPVSSQHVRARVQLCEQPAPGPRPVQGDVPVRIQDAVSVVDTYQYPDPEDAFSREPFVVKFSAAGLAARELVLIPLHAAPHQAVAEIDALYDVYLDVIDKWGTDVSPPLGPGVSAGTPRGLGHEGGATWLGGGSDPAARRPQDLLFLGDFNADCSYVRAQDWAAIRLRSSEIFKWLIPDSADTTVGNSDCAYDRIVACGAHLRRSLKPQSATALAISDHFPVEVTLKSHR
ncbi:Deoxyribonuclease-1-like 2 [Plecturocebus cupreus]